VGTPNVGKSSLFNALTGTYVTVSNYPGTTVEVSQGKTRLAGQMVTVIDTPGMYSLLPITEEERVARDLLLNTPVDLVLHVVDAKNLGRMLPLTFQLIEAGLPVLLVLNMIDEARQLNIQINREHLEQELRIPVVMMSAAFNIGVSELKAKVSPYVQSSRVPVAH
jgi:ferrous iron transport protein B